MGLGGRQPPDGGPGRRFGMTMGTCSLRGLRELSILAVAAALAAACGGASSGGASGSGTAPTTFLAQAQANVQKDYQSTDKAPDTTSRPAVKSKKLVVI